MNEIKGFKYSRKDGLQFKGSPRTIHMFHSAEVQIKDYTEIFSFLETMEHKVDDEVYCINGHCCIGADFSLAEDTFDSYDVDGFQMHDVISITNNKTGAETTRNFGVKFDEEFVYMLGKAGQPQFEVFSCEENTFCKLL